MIEKFPYGKAPFWLLILALSSTFLLLVTRGEQPPRPDLALVTFTVPHYNAYRKAIPRFEERFGVKVQLQQAHWTSLQSRLRNAMLAGTDVPDLVEMLGEGSLGFYTQGPREEIPLLDMTERVQKDGLDERVVSSRFAIWSTRQRIYALPHDVHPVMLAYRRDLIEALGIDVDQLDTWAKFVEVGRRVTRDKNGDGVIDQYMVDLPITGNWGLQTLLFQRDAQLFDEHGEVAFETENVVDLFVWYMQQTAGPRKIAFDCGWGQPFYQAMADGLALFFWTPDWRSRVYEDEFPKMKGKLGLIPLPAWRDGGRRTTSWGGTGLVIAKRTKDPDLAWEFAKFLYFDPQDLGQRFAETNIIPALTDAWDLPEFQRPNAYFSGLPIGKMYAELAPDTPAINAGPVDFIGRQKLDEAYSRSVEYYKSNGERGLREKIREELARSAMYVRRAASRVKRLEEAN